MPLNDSITVKSAFNIAFLISCFRSPIDELSFVSDARIVISAFEIWVPRSISILTTTSSEICPSANSAKPLARISFVHSGGKIVISPRALISMTLSLCHVFRWVVPFRITPWPSQILPLVPSIGSIPPLSPMYLPAEISLPILIWLSASIIIVESPL